MVRELQEAKNTIKALGTQLSTVLTRLDAAGIV
jgi:hypothetical protein